MGFIAVMLKNIMGLQASIGVDIIALIAFVMLFEVPLVLRGMIEWCGGDGFMSEFIAFPIAAVPKVPEDEMPSPLQHTILKSQKSLYLNHQKNLKSLW